MRVIKERLLILSKEKFDELSEIVALDDGGQKYVFKAKHNKYGEIVLKYVVCKSNQTLERAKREIETSYKLKGGYFAKIYEHGLIENKEETLIYVIEEYIDGSTLRDIIKENNNLTEQVALNIGVKLLSALKEIHSHNLVHRDVKPENIMIRNQHVYLLDMGIVRDLEKESITSDLAMFGPMTLGYAAPEQLKNEKLAICNRTDLFSWGVVMYECINGKNPFTQSSNSQHDIFVNTLNYRVPKLTTISGSFSDIIDLCLNKAVHRRPKSCDFVINVLKG